MLEPSGPALLCPLTSSCCSGLTSAKGSGFSGSLSCTQALGEGAYVDCARGGPALPELTEPDDRVIVEVIGRAGGGLPPLLPQSSHRSRCLEPLLPGPGVSGHVHCAMSAGKLVMGDLDPLGATLPI